MLLVLPHLPSSYPWDSPSGQYLLLSPGALASHSLHSCPDRTPSVKSGHAVSLPKTLVSLQKTLVFYFRIKYQCFCVGGQAGCGLARCPVPCVECRAPSVPAFLCGQLLKLIGILLKLVFFQKLS